MPDPSGQLAELIFYITSTRVDLYSHQILLDTREFATTKLLQIGVPQFSPWTASASND